MPLIKEKEKDRGCLKQFATKNLFQLHEKTNISSELGSKATKVTKPL